MTAIFASEDDLLALKQSPAHEEQVPQVSEGEPEVQQRIQGITLRIHFCLRSAILF
jgi:hypothetical protein